MSGSVLRLGAAALLTVCGFCAGDARRQKFSVRRRTLEAVISLLTRLRQEISYRRTDLNALYRSLAAGQSASSPLAASFQTGDTFSRMAPPGSLRPEEAACFTECFSSLGHTDAKQECARLDYYLDRFESYLTLAREEEQLSASLDRRLGLAAGAMLGLLLL